MKNLMEKVKYLLDENMFGSNYTQEVHIWYKDKHNICFS